MAKRIREKSAKRLANADKRPQATVKYIRMSASKVRIVLDIIRGKDYNEAMAILESTPKGASEVLVKLLASAGANAENNLNMSKNDLFVAEAFANEGPTYKRWWPRSHGSADTILKRTSHITIVLDEKNNIVAKPVVKTTETVKPAIVEDVKVVEEKKEEVVKTAPKTAPKTAKTATKATTKTATKTATKSVKEGK